MNWKGPLLALTIMFAIIMVYTAFSTHINKDSIQTKQNEQFVFDMSIKEYGLLDSGNGIRGFATADTIMTGADNSNASLIMLPRPPSSDIYEVDDYPSDRDKQNIMETAEGKLREYDIEVQSITAEDAISKSGSVIIIPSDAMPIGISPQELKTLVSNNTVIFFGKSFDIALDATGSQVVSGNDYYNALGLIHDADGALESATDSQIRDVGSAQVIDRGGWLVLFNDSSDIGTGLEIADMIIRQKWQNNIVDTPINITSNGTISLYSDQVDQGNYSIRIVAEASGSKNTTAILIDLPQVSPMEGKLRINQSLSDGGEVNYSFELHDNLEYPIAYETHLAFFKDGVQIDSESAKDIVMQTVSLESGSVQPNLSAGSYVVRLIDQNAVVHAIAYTHIPDVKVRLIRIEGASHVFLVTIDGEPAAQKKVTLIVNGNDSFQLSTDDNGEMRANFLLGPGMYRFDIELGQNTATTYYDKTNDEPYLLYIVLGIGALFLCATFLIKGNGKRRYRIRTHQRPGSNSKPFRISRSAFMELFSRAQADRAPTMPLSVSDLRLGIRKHATYKGVPVFLTDSNLFYILETLSCKGDMLSYGGYFLPSTMSKGIPIECWVLRRKISDVLIEMGLQPDGKNGSDFCLGEKLVYVWGGFEPSQLTKVCRKKDGIIVFPDDNRKKGFIASTMRYDPDSMRLSLELRHGRISLQTLDEFMERIPNAR